jgi:hypothetical protein
MDDLHFLLRRHIPDDTNAPKLYRSAVTDQLLLQFMESIKRDEEKDRAINPYFFQFEERIRNCLTDRSNGSSKYVQGIDADLKHIEDRSTPLQHDSVLTLIHPFYIFLTHRDLIGSNPHAQAAANYLDRLLDVIFAAKENKVHIVLIETLHHYAAASNFLLEYGYVDDVILTVLDQGFSINPAEFEKLEGKAVYAAGTYNGSCFNHHLADLNSHLQPKDIWMLNDLILHHPSSRYLTVSPSQVEFPKGSGLLQSHVITLNEFYGKIIS